MDLSQVPEEDRQGMLQLLEKKQADQFVRMYSSIIATCFKDCINDFTGEVLSSREKDCLKNCTTKILRVANRMGQLMAEQQPQAEVQASAMASAPASALQQRS